MPGTQTYGQSSSVTASVTAVSSCLGFPPEQTVICNPGQPFSFQVAFGQCFITARETGIGIVGKFPDKTLCTEVSSMLSDFIQWLVCLWGFSTRVQQCGAGEGSSSMVKHHCDVWSSKHHNEGESESVDSGPQLSCLQREWTLQHRSSPSNVYLPPITQSASVCETKWLATPLVHLLAAS